MQNASLKAPAETIITQSPRLSCDGGKGPLGHPLVFLTVNQDSFVDCPYCGRHFELAKDAAGSGH